MVKKTKILAAGDIHGDTGLVKKLAKRAEKENVDLVILSGDITFFDDSTKNLIGPFKKINKPVLILHGNHEPVSTTEFLAQAYGPDTTNLHGKSIIKNDIGIFGAGGTTQIGPEPPIKESEIFKLLETGFNEIKHLSKKIMVTHEHPVGSKSEFEGYFSGSKGIAKALKKFQPNILIHSHIHEADGIEEKIGKTKIINVGRSGRIIEI